MMTTLLTRIDAAVRQPTDTTSVVIRKRILVMAQFAGLASTAGYGIACFLLSYNQAASIFAAYVVITGLTLLNFLKKGNLLGFVIPGSILSMMVSFSTQISLGGYLQSGIMSVYALIGPTIALYSQNRKLRVSIFGIYLAGIATLAVFDPQIRAAGPEIPLEVSLIFGAVNLVGMSFFVFGMTALILAELENAHARADELLLNILPGPIAEKLKHKRETIADGFTEVTILFADIVDFTQLSSGADPVDVVNLLNAIFSDFDRLADKHGLEKIKTIGDAYMVAGGLPEPRDDHAQAVMSFAIDMLKTLENHRAWNDEVIHLRVGINTGPVVAGVIGRHKFIYDLWGDAVNTASRMESNGMSDVIQVTGSTYHKLRDQYTFEQRGPIHIKGKGEMSTYLLTGIS